MYCIEHISHSLIQVTALTTAYLILGVVMGLPVSPSELQGFMVRQQQSCSMACPTDPKNRALHKYKRKGVSCFPTSLPYNLLGDISLISIGSGDSKLTIVPMENSTIIYK